MIEHRLDGLFRDMLNGYMNWYREELLNMMIEDGEPTDDLDSLCEGHRSFILKMFNIFKNGSEEDEE